MHRCITVLLVAAGLVSVGCGKSSADVLLDPSETSGATPDTDYLATRAHGFGFVELQVSRDNQIIALRTILTVPALPTASSGTLFVSPGVQPGGQNYEPIDNGVLEPVLTWGPSCAPSSPGPSFTSWWIAGQYVNTYGSYAGYTGCHSGDGMAVQVGGPLSIHLSLDGTVWRQSVENLRDGTAVTFDLDMLDQFQNYLHFWLDPASADPVEDAIFTSTLVTFAEPEAAACQPTVRGNRDFFSNPHASADGTECSIERIVLRAQGVPASTQN
jgi:hypothetical protein